MQVRNQHPAELTVLTQMPRSARVYKSGLAFAALNVDWTSYWLKVGTGRDSLRLDGELLRTEAVLGIGLGAGFDFEFRLPMLHYSGGVLDSFIEGWHDSFGLRQNQRDEFPRNQLELKGVKNFGGGQNSTIFEAGKHGYRLGDIPLHLAWFPLPAGSGGGLSFGVRRSIALATGDENRGFGNGGIDRALGIVAQLDAGPISLFTWASHAWIHTPNRAKAAELRYPDQQSFGFGVELGASERLTGLLQISVENSVLRNLANEHAKRTQAIIWMGGRYRVSETASIEFSIGEDLVPNVSPDIQFHLGFRYQF